MRKLRYIPIIALTALLSSCDLFGGNKMKAPSFAKEGDEVKYSEFKEKLQQAAQDCEFSDEESILGDRVEKVSTSQSEVRNWKRGKKEIEKSDEQRTSKGESQYDYDNLVAKATTESKVTTKSSSQTGSESSTSTYNTETYFQFDKISGTKYLIQADAKRMVYSGAISVSGKQTEEDVFDNLVRGDISVIYSYFMYSIPSEQLAKEYLFHVNGDTLFTFSLDTDEDVENNANYVYHTSTKLKAQLDLTNKKEVFRYSYEYKEEYTYNRDYDVYQEDDVVTVETKAYAEYTVNAKSVTVKPVSLENYTLNN